MERKLVEQTQSEKYQMELVETNNRTKIEMELKPHNLLFLLLVAGKTTRRTLL